MTRPSPPFFNLIIFSLLLRVRSIYFCISATPHRITSEIGHLVLPPTPLTDPPPRYPPRSYPRLISLYPVTLTPFLTEPDLGYVDLLDFLFVNKTPDVDDDDRRRRHAEHEPRRRRPWHPHYIQ